jgi:hypothetical protein
VENGNGVFATVQALRKPVSSRAGPGDERSERSGMGLEGKWTGNSTSSVMHVPTIAECADDLSRQGPYNVRSVFIGSGFLSIDGCRT